MTAPRAREQADPPSPPDRLPPRRGGRPSAETYSAAGRLRGLVRSGRRAVLAAAGLTAIVLAAGLALAPPAQAQTTTQIWSATLTPAAIAGTVVVGYDQVNGTLSDQTFSYNRKNYTFEAVQNVVQGGSNLLFVRVSRNFDRAARSDLIMVVGTAEFSLANASVSGDEARWSNTGLGWSAGTDVSLSLKAITGRPTTSAGQVRADGNKLWLVFNENLSNMFPPKSALTVTAGGSPVTIGRIKLETSRTLELTDLSPLIAQGQTVTVDYTDPSIGDDTNAIQDTGGVCPRN